MHPKPKALNPGDVEVLKQKERRAPNSGHWLPSPLGGGQKGRSPFDVLGSPARHGPSGPQPLPGQAGGRPPRGLHLCVALAQMLGFFVTFCGLGFLTATTLYL